MADVRSMYCYWQPYGHCHFKNPHLVYVPVVYYPGFADRGVYGAGLLDEHEKIYIGCQAQSIMVFMNRTQ